MRLIKFRGVRIDNGEYVYGEFGHGAISGNPIIYSYDNQQGWVGADVDPNSVKQLIGLDHRKEVIEEIYEGDITDFDSISGEPLSAELAVVLVDKYGKHYYAPKEITWLVGSDSEYKSTVWRD